MSFSLKSYETKFLYESVLSKSKFSSKECSICGSVDISLKSNLAGGGINIGDQSGAKVYFEVVCDECLNSQLVEVNSVIDVE